MSNQTRKLIFYSCLLTMAWCNTSCGNSQDDKSANTPAVKKTQQPSVAPTKKQTYKAESFESFYAKFSSAIDNNNWRVLSSLTKFPFTFRGQLDLEGEVKLDQKQFEMLFPKFLELETFIDLGGEDFPTTYRVIAITPLEASKNITDNNAEIHDFVFTKENNHWRFVQAFTDINNIDLIKD